MNITVEQVQHFSILEESSTCKERYCDSKCNMSAIIKATKFLEDLNNVL